MKDRYVIGLLLKDKNNQHTDYVLIKKPTDSNRKPIPSLQQYLGERDDGAGKLSDQENRLNQLSKISIKLA